MLKRSAVAGLTMVSVLSLGLPNAFATSPGAARLEVVGDTVTVRTAGQSQFEPAANQQTVNVGDTIRTGNSAAILKMTDNSVVRASAGSEFKVVSLGDKNTRISLRKGRVLAKGSQIYSQIKVDTPTGGASGMGSTYSVSLSEGKGDAEVKVLSGTASLSGDQVVDKGNPSATPAKEMTAMAPGELLAQDQTSKEDLYHANEYQASTRARGTIQNLSDDKKSFELKTADGEIIQVKLDDKTDVFRRFTRTPAELSDGLVVEVGWNHDFSSLVAVVVWVDDPLATGTPNNDTLLYSLGGVAFIGGIIALTQGGGDNPVSP